MPLIRRLPKRGFNNAAFHKNYAIVNLTDLNEFKAGTVVDEKLLRDAEKEERKQSQRKKLMSAQPKVIELSELVRNGEQ